MSIATLSVDNEKGLPRKPVVTLEQADHGEMARLKMSIGESRVKVRKLNSKSFKLQPFHQYRKQQRFYLLQ